MLLSCVSLSCRFREILVQAVVNVTAADKRGAAEHGWFFSPLVAHSWANSASYSSAFPKLSSSAAVPQVKAVFLLPSQLQ